MARARSHRVPKGRIVALVPLRGGSKSIPRKNVRPIAGRPLCAWSLSAALATPAIAEVWTSTDDAEVAEAARRVDARVRVLDRPASLAGDRASTESAMLHFARHVPFDWLVTLQATSPLTTPEDLARGLDLVAREGLDSLVTGTRLRRFLWNDDGRPINYDPKRRPRRQDFRGTRMENGAFYVTSRRILERTRCRLGGRVGFLELAEDAAVELDEPADWPAVEGALLRRTPWGERLRSVRGLVLDVDGTLTDASMWYGPDGEVMKRFDTRDGHGLVALRAAGVRVAFLTGEATPFAAARAKKLGVDDVVTGCREKDAGLRTIRDRWGLAAEEVAFMGDDALDLPALRAAGLAVAPADARPEALALAHVVTSAPGGHGAVRELCDLLLRARG